MAKPKYKEGKRIDPRRLDRAEELFCGLGPEGVPLPTTKILEILSNEFGVGKDQARNYLKVARGRLAERVNGADVEAEIERSNLMFLDAFRVAKDKGDPHGMVGATHRRAELLGIFQRNVKVQAEVKGVGELFAQAFALVPEERPKREDSDASKESSESYDDS